MPFTDDLIVLIPGILGSTLKHRDHGQIWGLQAYPSAWLPGTLDRLSLRPEELDAILSDTYEVDQAPVQPVGLIKFPQLLHSMGGLEPYTRLLDGLRRGALLSESVVAFPYDWRLPVVLNAGRLRQFITTELGELQRFRRSKGLPNTQLQAVIVAHSMGGLLARALAGTESGFEGIRSVITLGTPFYGALKALRILDQGVGAPLPLPHKALRDAARTMPGMYDLLPRYECVLERARPAPAANTPETKRRLEERDVHELGGDAQLFTLAGEQWQSLSGTGLPDFRSVSGVRQPTLQSVEFTHGEARYHQWCLHQNEAGEAFTQDDAGDSTVWRYSAAPHRRTEIPLGLSHGQMGKSTTVADTVVALINRDERGIPLGDGVLSLDVPDLVTDGNIPIRVGGTDRPSQVYCRVEDAVTDKPVRHPRLARRDEALVASAGNLGAGLYRVSVKAGGLEAVSQLVEVAVKP